MHTPLRSRFTLSALLLFTVAAVLAGCPKKDKNPPQGAMLLTPDKLTLTVGETGQLTATVSPGGNTAVYTWTSDNEPVATVSTTGLVSGISPGNAVVTVSANGKSATADITVLAFNGSSCREVLKVQSWTGSLTLDYSDTATYDKTSVDVMHQFNVDFTLTVDPNQFPVAATSVRFIGTPTGTATMQESVNTVGGSNQTNNGDGAAASMSDFALVIDADTCVFNFAWEWGVAATYSIDGTAQLHPDPEKAGGVQSKDVPLGTWQQGISYSAGFPTFSGLSGTTPTPDFYVLVSLLGYDLFGNAGGSRGPAGVAFSAAPTSPVP